MARKPHTIADLSLALSARSEWLAKSAILLQRASMSLAEALENPPLNTLGDLMRWITRRQERLQAAQLDVRKAGQSLADDLTAIRHVTARIDQELGIRRRPGRPAVVTEEEKAAATFARERGGSWEQVRRHLNAVRRQRGLPALSSSTLRSAVNRYPPAKKPSGNRH
jgi:hypothetical protein